MSTTLTDLHMLDEPELEFRYGQRLIDPRDGLAMFGPYNADEASHPQSIVYGLIAGATGSAAFRGFTATAQRAWTSAPKDRHRLWPPFPGFETAFASKLPFVPAWEHRLDPAALIHASKHRDPLQRCYDVVNVILDALAEIKQIDTNLGVVVVVIPDEIYQNCRPESKVTGGIGERILPKQKKSRQSGQRELFETFTTEQYDLSPDFRQQLKARAMHFGVPLQIIRESTLRIGDEKVLGQRQLSPMSHRLWNIWTTIFYKCGGKPWRLASAREGVSYLGLAFRRASGKWGPRTACCAAQMFLADGDGIVFLGEYGPWYSETNRQYHLSRAAARNLIRGAIETYTRQHGKPLTEVFLHSRSEISAEEFAGYRDGCPVGVKLVGVKVRSVFDGPRLYRDGSMPVMRGLFWQMSDRRGYLYASGFKPRLGTYDGPETPAPLEIDVQHGDASVLEVSRDILALTKLNYNSCTLGDAQPVTVGFSDAVGEILVSNPGVTERSHLFKNYI